MTKPKLYEICVHTAKEFGLTKQQFLSKCRRHNIAHPRQIAFFLSCCHGYSLPTIGRFYGKDHTSILYGRDAVAKRMTEDLDLRLKIVKIDSNAVLAAEKRLGLVAATVVGTGLVHMGQVMKPTSISVSIGGISEIPFEPSYRL